MNEERVTELEIKMTYLEDALAVLNAEIIAQRGLIERLELEIEDLKTEKNALEIRGNEKPPHY